MPELGISRRLTQCNNVLLPPPGGPISAPKLLVSVCADLLPLMSSSSARTISIALEPR